MILQFTLQIHLGRSCNIGTLERFDFKLLSCVLPDYIIMIAGASSRSTWRRCSCTRYLIIKCQNVSCHIIVAYCKSRQYRIWCSHSVANVTLLWYCELKCGWACCYWCVTCQWATHCYSDSTSNIWCSKRSNCKFLISVIPRDIWTPSSGTSSGPTG